MVGRKSQGRAQLLPYSNVSKMTRPHELLLFMGYSLSIKVYVHMCVCIRVYVYVYICVYIYVQMERVANKSDM